ncbi:hypothetical protein BT93_F2083 [Corymbia citriodora subsp. variegata]|nr:hypothetical protein BT93_F2083 [Corymbia citriodora subsp. variegata]
MASSSGGVPPGFRFHPTDEELLQYYLKKKVSFQKFDMEVIREVDLNKMEPWELQERCKIGSTPQNEWYFFSHKDRKYPTGSRTNRATNAGFWKATGRDKCIRNTHKKIGMRKTLVFYRGRAPHGQKTDWIMHEYRLEDGDDLQGNPNEDGWVVCRVFKKKNLFKIAGNDSGGQTSVGSDQNHHHQQLSINSTSNTTAHQPRSFMHRDSSLYLHSNHLSPSTAFELNKTELGLHYSSSQHLPQYSLFPSSQALIPTPKPIGYHDYTALQSADAVAPPVMLKQLMSSNARDQCESGSDSFRYQNCDQGLEVGTCEATQEQMVGARDEAGMGDWGMLSVTSGAHNQLGSHNEDDSGSKGVRFEDGTATTSLHPINHLSLRGEMDFWGYGK